MSTVSGGVDLGFQLVHLGLQLGLEVGKALFGGGEGLFGTLYIAGFVHAPPDIPHGGGCAAEGARTHPLAAEEHARDGGAEGDGRLHLAGLRLLGLSLPGLLGSMHPLLESLPLGRVFLFELGQRFLTLALSGLPQSRAELLLGLTRIGRRLEPRALVDLDGLGPERPVDEISAPGAV